MLSAKVIELGPSSVEVDHGRKVSQVVHRGRRSGVGIAASQALSDLDKAVRHS